MEKCFIERFFFVNVTEMIARLKEKRYFCSRIFNKLKTEGNNNITASQEWEGFTLSDIGSYIVD